MRKEGFLTPKTPFGMTGLGWRSDWGGVEIEEGFHRANFARWCRVLTYVTRRAGMRREEKAGSLRFAMTGERREAVHWRVEWWECCRDPSTERRLRGADAPVPSKLRASGMTGGFDVGAAIEEAGAWLKPGTYMRLRWGACTTQTVVLGGLFGVADLLHYGLD
jgi:hypothetical protein